jgi:putative component of toxin-antitoxin plasmid stabilization module
MWTVRELLLEDGSSPFEQWFASLKPDVAAKVAVAQMRMQSGNHSNIAWFRGIGEFKIDYGAGWRIY